MDGSPGGADRLALRVGQDIPGRGARPGLQDLEAVAGAGFLPVSGERESHLRERIQKHRAQAADVERGRPAVGDRRRPGESVAEALAREAEEEIGLRDISARLLGRHIIVTAYESEYTYVFMAMSDGPFHPNPQEVEEARFWTIAEITGCLGSGMFTTNFEQDWMQFFQGSSSKSGN